MTRPSSAVGRELLRHLASTLDGIIVLPDDVAYDEARQVWNRAVDRRPAAIVSCASVDDVRRGLEFAMTHRLEIAVRSGGHSQAGHGVADGALVLDLRRLNRGYQPVLAERPRRGRGDCLGADDGLEAVWARDADRRMPGRGSRRPDARRR